MSVSKRCVSSKSTVSTCGSGDERRKPATSIKSERSFDSCTKNTFNPIYATTCANYKTRPMPCVKFNSKTNSIEVLGDRLKANDWKAVMEAIRTDTSAHHIRVKNKQYAGNLAKEYETFTQALGAPKNVQASSTLYVVRTIASAVCDVLTNTEALVCLELENVLFDEQSLDALISGVSVNQTLQHFSLAYSRMGDNACLALCRVLRDKPNMRSVNLSGCCLSPASGLHGLADLIKKQQMKRHEECWAHSLRVRSPNPDLMQGLRRLTLNDNAELRDEGVADLLESLKDDMYVKALDIQNCGLTDRGAQLALSTLMVNDAIVVLDIRKNASISSAALETVMTQLCANNADKLETKQWKWTKLDLERPHESLITLA